MSIFEMVKRDLDDRNQLGHREYGGELTVDTDRNWLVEAYQEALDLAVYLRGEIEKRKRFEPSISRNGERQNAKSKD